MAALRDASGRELLLLFLAAVPVVVLGVLALWTPFSVDQALFVYGGRSLTEGGVLYRDFWDIKQPGIFFFYAAAGRLIGFAEPGIHLFELAWQLGLALTLAWLLRAAGGARAAVALAPLAAVGVYYGAAGSEQLTQVEALVGLPLALCLLAVLKLGERRESAGWSLLLGASAAVVGAFKLAYLPLPAGFAALLAAERLRRQGVRAAGALARIAGWSLVGVGAVWIPLLGYFAANHALPQLYWTSLGYPAEALREVAASPPERLVASLRWTLRAYLPLAPLVLLGLTSLWRGRRLLLARAVGVYLVFGLGLIAVQRWSWWEYHQVLLFPPLGLLAGLGLDRLLAARSARPWIRRLVVGAALVLVLLPVADLALDSARRTRRLLAAASMDSDASLPIRLDASYLRMWEGTRFLRRRRARPGAIHVFGDPRLVLLSERRQAIAVHGHAWNHFPERLWRRLPAELMAARPAWVYLSHFDRGVLRRHSPELLAFLTTEYRPARRLLNGEWLVSREPVSEELRRLQRAERRARRRRASQD